MHRAPTARTRLTALAACLAIAALAPRLARPVDLLLHDVGCGLRAARPFPAEFLSIDVAPPDGGLIDKEALARCVQTLTERGARLVIVDLLHPEKVADQPGLPQLYEAVRRSDRVVWVASLTTEGSADYVLPYRELKPRDTGYGNFIQGADFVVRKMPLYYTAGERVYTSLALSAYLVDRHLRAPESPAPEAMRTRMGQEPSAARELPIDHAGGVIWVNYQWTARASAYPMPSLVRLDDLYVRKAGALEETNTLRQLKLKDRIAFIVQSPHNDRSDLFLTPGNGAGDPQRVPGAFIHASVLASLLSGEGLWTPSEPALRVLLFALALAGLAWSHRRARPGFDAAPLLAAGALAAGGPAVLVGLRGVLPAASCAVAFAAGAWAARLLAPAEEAAATAVKTESIAPATVTPAPPPPAPAPAAMSANAKRTTRFTVPDDPHADSATYSPVASRDTIPSRPDTDTPTLAPGPDSNTAADLPTLPPGTAPASMRPPTARASPYQALEDLLRQATHDRYGRMRPLGKGGMGALFVADDLVLSRTVAVKFLDPALARTAPQIRERFVREAKLMARLAAAGFPVILEDCTEHESPFLVMEKIEGETLRELLARHGPLDPQEICRLAAEFARMMTLVHRAHVVHRDIKPANLMIDRTGRLRLLDLGIAGEQESGLTAAGQRMGTPAYMPPEQERGEETGPAADVYSFGVMFYELLCGKLPFEGRRVALHHHHTYPAAVGIKRRDVPPALSEILMRCLAPYPHLRPPSFAAIQRQLSLHPNTVHVKDYPRLRRCMVDVMATSVHARGAHSPGEILAMLEAIESGEGSDPRRWARHLKRHLLRVRKHHLAGEDAVATVRRLQRLAGSYSVSIPRILEEAAPWLPLRATLDLPTGKTDVALTTAFPATTVAILHEVLRTLFVRSDGRVETGARLVMSEAAGRAGASAVLMVEPGEGRTLDPELRQRAADRLAPVLDLLGAELDLHDAQRVGIRFSPDFVVPGPHRLT